MMCKSEWGLRWVFTVALKVCFFFGGLHKGYLWDKVLCKFQMFLLYYWVFLKLKPSGNWATYCRERMWGNRSSRILLLRIQNDSLSMEINLPILSKNWMWLYLLTNLYPSKCTSRNLHQSYPGQNTKRHLLQDFHCYTVSNSTRLETTRTSFSGKRVEHHYGLSMCFS